jgi:hypothetical protein
VALIWLHGVQSGRKLGLLLADITNPSQLFVGEPHPSSRVLSYFTIDI